MAKKFPSEAQLRCFFETPTNNGWMPIPSKFLLGNFRVTPRADKLLAGLEIGYALALHAQGDWGNVSEETWAKNNHNHLLESGGRLLSFYSNHDGVDFYILTEADRSVTSLFLPYEHKRFLPDNK